MYQNLGIAPSEGWSGYPGGFSDSKIRTLPLRNYLGKDNNTFYYSNINTKPPIKSTLLKFLGVRYILLTHPITGSGFTEWYQPKEIEKMIDDLKPLKKIPIGSLALPGIEANHYLAVLENPLSRAFILEGATYDTYIKLAAEITPIVDNNYLYLGSERFPIKKVIIDTYKPEYVKLEVTSLKGGILIFTDLYHPNWSVKINCKLGKINQAYGIVRSVFLKPGKHDVEFRYSVPWLYEATILSISEILILFIYTLFLFSRKKLIKS